MKDEPTGENRIALPTYLLLCQKSATLQLIATGDRSLFHGSLVVTPKATGEAFVKDPWQWLTAGCGHVCFGFT